MWFQHGKVPDGGDGASCRLYSETAWAQGWISLELHILVALLGIGMLLTTDNGGDPLLGFVSVHSVMSVWLVLLSFPAWGCFSSFALALALYF